MAVTLGTSKDTPYTHTKATLSWRCESQSHGWAAQPHQGLPLGHEAAPGAVSAEWGQMTWDSLGVDRPAAL